MRQVRAGGRGGGARRLSIDEEHSVVRCRLDFVTNRQLRKLRTLADLRLAAVSSLQVAPPPQPPPCFVGSSAMFGSLKAEGVA